MKKHKIPFKIVQALVSFVFSKILYIIRIIRNISKTSEIPILGMYMNFQKSTKDEKNWFRIQPPLQK